MGTSATVGSVGINVRANVDQFNKDLDKATKSLKDLSAKEFKIGGLTADKSKLAKIITDGMMDGFSGVFRNLKRMFENSLEDSIANKVLSGGSTEPLGAVGTAASVAAGSNLTGSWEKFKEAGAKAKKAMEERLAAEKAARAEARNKARIERAGGIRSPRLKDLPTEEALKEWNNELIAQIRGFSKTPIKKGQLDQLKFVQNKAREVIAPAPVTGGKDIFSRVKSIPGLDKAGEAIKKTGETFLGLNKNVIAVYGTMGLLAAAGGVVVLAFNKLQDVAEDSLKRFNSSIFQFASTMAAAGKYMEEADLERKRIWEENLASSAGLIVIWEEFKTNISIVLSNVTDTVLDAFLSVVQALYYLKDKMFGTDTAKDFRAIIDQQIAAAKLAAEQDKKLANLKKGEKAPKPPKEKKEKEKTPFTDLYKDTMYKVRETLMEQLWLKMGEMPPPPKPVSEYKMEALTYGSQAAIDAVASVGDKQLTVLQRIAKNTQTKADDAYTLVRW